MLYTILAVIIALIIFTNLKAVVRFCVEVVQVGIVLTPLGLFLLWIVTREGAMLRLAGWSCIPSVLTLMYVAGKEET